MYTNRKSITITLVFVSLVIMCSQTHFVNAQLHPDTPYIIYGKGHGIKKTTYGFDLQIRTGSNQSGKVPISLIDGLIIYNEKYFVTAQNWNGILIQNNGLIMLSGNAMGDNKSMISIIMLGRQINNTQHGTIYLLAGNIAYNDQRETFVNTTEIVNTHFLTNNEIQNEMPHLLISQNHDLQRLVSTPKKDDAITLITKHYSRVYLEYPYSFTSKVYYLKDNPKDDFAQHGGEVSNVHITADIINPNGDIVKSFNGTTNQFGYFSDSFLPPDDSVIGRYLIHITAEKDGVIDTNELTMDLFKRPVLGNAQQSDFVISPDAPSGLVAVAKDKKTINLSWSAPSTPSGKIIGYMIERESPIGGGWSVIEPNTGKPKDTTYSDKSLTTKTEYNYRVHAVYADHVSSSSNTASAVTK